MEFLLKAELIDLEWNTQFRIKLQIISRFVTTKRISKRHFLALSHGSSSIRSIFKTRPGCNRNVDDARRQTFHFFYDLNEENPSGVGGFISKKQRWRGGHGNKHGV